MNNLIFSLQATIPVFLTMVIGYLLKRIHLIDDAFTAVLNRFNYRISLPALLFLDLYQADFFAVWDTSYVLFCLLSTLTGCIAITILSYFLLKDKTILGEFVQASYRGSAAVLGIAFIMNIYGQVHTTPLMIIATVPLYNIYAVLLLSFTDPIAMTEGATRRANRTQLKKSIRGILTNPILLGILLGMLASISRIHLPVLITKTIGNFSALATPLALIGLGAGFEGRRARARIKPTIACTLVRLVILPVTFLPIAAHMGFRGEDMVAILIMLGAPTTASGYIMARNMNHEGTLTSSVVVSTTFLSALTLTFWLFVL
ncbi:MAG: AEC family transporter, partial [Lachnospiraceae bacterium]|nr:AEC family transporter [Lachnospiraceae bacterium]